MGKNKYTPDGGLKTEDGEKKSRNHTKTGKLAKRRETRRLEAIARQTRRIIEIEKSIQGGKVDEKIAEYISSFKVPMHAVEHAKMVLQSIRGGTPLATLAAAYRKLTEGGTTPASVAVEAKPAEEKPKNKYRRKKQAKSAINNQNGDPI